MKRLTQLLMIIALSITCAYGQTASVLDHTMQWNSSTYTDLYTGATVSQNFTIVTSGSSITVTSGGTTKTFDITAADGTWITPENTGSLTCSVSYGDKNGTISLDRTLAGVSVTIDFSAYPNAMKRKFIIADYEQQN